MEGPVTRVEFEKHKDDEYAHSNERHTQDNEWTKVVGILEMRFDNKMATYERRFENLGAKISALGVRIDGLESWRDMAAGQRQATKESAARANTLATVAMGVAAASGIIELLLRVTGH